MDHYRSFSNAEMFLHDSLGGLTKLSQVRTLLSSKQKVLAKQRNNLLHVLRTPISIRMRNMHITYMYRDMRWHMHALYYTIHVSCVLPKRKQNNQLIIVCVLSSTVNHSTAGVIVAISQYMYHAVCDQHHLPNVISVNTGDEDFSLMVVYKKSPNHGDFSLMSNQTISLQTKGNETIGVIKAGCLQAWSLIVGWAKISVILSCL